MGAGSCVPIFSHFTVFKLSKLDTSQTHISCPFWSGSLSLRESWHVYCMIYIRHFYVERESGVESVDTKHAGAGLGDAIIKIYCDKHKCD